MLTEDKKDSSFQAIKEVIHEITNDFLGSYAQGDFATEAIVNGKTVFKGTVLCHLQIDHNEGKISIYWEKAGMPEYRKKGLFGQITSSYQEVRILPASILQIIGNSPQYTIYVNYRS